MSDRPREPEALPSSITVHTGVVDPQATVLSVPGGGPRGTAVTPDDLGGAAQAGEPPKDLAGCRLGRKLGSGGMGSVFAAVAADGTTIALKVLRPDLVGDADFSARFRREAQAMAEVSHPNLIRLVGSGEDRGWLWLAMEYMPDGDLRSYLKRRGQLMEKDAIAYVQRCALGLQALHARGLVHRDFKPENVFLDQGRGKAGSVPLVKVGDLGLARHAGGQDRMTLTGNACGTPAYMAPEQVRGDGDLDHRVDIYALGATLFKLTTGQEPFAGSTVFMLTDAVLNHPVPDPRRFNATLSPGIVAIMLKAMAKDRRERYQSMGEMVGDLERLAAGKVMNHTAISPASMIFKEVAGQPAPKPVPRPAAGGGDGLLPGLGGMGPVLRLAVPTLLVIGGLTIVTWSISGPDVPGRRTAGAPRPAPAAVPAAPAGPRLAMVTDRWGPVLTVPLPGAGMTLRWCPPGRFQRGHADGPAWEAPQTVVLTHGFWIQEGEMTRAQWAAVLGEAAPAADGGLPVGEVSHDQAVQGCERLAARWPGLGARLPTEAEFEYAALAGRAAASEAPVACTEPMVLEAWTSVGQSQEARSSSWLDSTIRARSQLAGLGPQAAGGHAPNPWGVVDLLGNQQEWCLDRWDGTTPYGAGEARDPRGETGSLVALRGGSWVHPAAACTAHARGAQASDLALPWIGFRLVVPGGGQAAVPELHAP